MSTAPPSHRPIFLLGFPRGGTTFVQRVLNCHRRVTVWGENNGIVSLLRRAHEAFATPPKAVPDRAQYLDFTRFADRFLPRTVPIDESEFALRIRDLLTSTYVRPGEDERFWGFKEFRHEPVEDVEFLLRLFPHGRVAFLLRHPRELLLSQFRVSWSDAGAAASAEAYVRRFLETYRARVEAISTAAARWPASVRVWRYEALAERVEPASLFGDVGVPEEGIDHDLLAVALRTKVGSSFGDVGREVDPRDEREIRRLYEALAGSAFAEESRRDGGAR